MTSRSYFGKMNSTHGSVVPLAMFENRFHPFRMSLEMAIRVFLATSINKPLQHKNIWNAVMIGKN